MGFREEAAAAAESLARLNREADRTAKGEAKREQDRERSFAAAAFGAVGGVGGLARGLTPAANAFGAGASAGDAADVAASSAFEALARTSIGGFLGGLIGTNRGLNAKTNAREQVIDELSPLAAFNVPIDSDAMQKLIDVRVAQQERVELLKADVTTRTAYTVGDATKDAAGGRLGDALETFAVAVEDLKKFIDSLPFVSRSGGQ